MSAEPQTTTRSHPSWSELVRGLFSTAIRHRATVEEAEDLVQETIEVALRSPGWFDESRGTKLTAMRAILRNRLIDRRRHRSVQQRAHPHLVLLTEPDPSIEQQLDQERASDLRRALITQLSPIERQLFQAWLRQRRGDWRAADAAQALDLTPAAYEAAKKRLRRRCRAILIDLGIETTDLFGGRS